MPKEMPQTARSLWDKLEFPANQNQSQREVVFTELYQNQYWSSGPKENERDMYIKWKIVLEVRF